MTGRYVYYTIRFTVANFPIYIFKIKQIQRDFSQLSLDTQMKNLAVGAITTAPASQTDSKGVCRESRYLPGN